MRAQRVVVPLALLIGLGMPIPGRSAIVQTSSTAEKPPPPPPGLRKLTGDDARRAEELDRAIDAAVKADRWGEAVSRAKALLDLRERILGPKHHQTVDSRWRLESLRRVESMSPEDRATYQTADRLSWEALRLYGQGKYLEAQPILEKVLEIHRRLLGDDHPTTALSENSTAVNLAAQGKYAEAQPLLEKALEIRRRQLGDDHPSTAESYDSLAFNFYSRGQPARAQPLLEKALEARRRQLGEDHPATIGAYNSLGINLYGLGEYLRAQPLLEKALDYRRGRFGDDHPSTAQSYNNLAYNLDAQGQHARAQPLHEKALEIRRRLLGDDHLDVATCYNNLAGNLRDQGEPVRAQPLMEKALEIHRSRLGEDHPDTALSYNNLGMVLNDQGKHAAALPMLEKGLEIRRRLLSDAHPRTAESYNNLAINLKDQGRYAAALPVFEKALAIFREQLGEDHPHTALCYDNVACDLDAQGEYVRARPLHEKGLEIQRRLLGDDHPQTAYGYHDLALNLDAQGRYAEACDRWRGAVRSLDAARLRMAYTGLGRAGLSHRPVRPALAALLARLGRPADAWQALEADLGRGLLDELAARQDRRLSPAERNRLRDLTDELGKLDRLEQSTPRGLDQAGRAQRFEELKHRRELASIALGEFRSKLVREYGPVAGSVAGLDDVQAALPADAALIAWVDRPPAGPNAADPNGEHWGVVVRARGLPAWIRLAGTGVDGHWTDDDTDLAGKVRERLRRRPDAGTADAPTLAGRLRVQRIDPMAGALAATADGLPAARRLIVLPSPALAGLPIEAMLAPDDTRTVSYAPSATIFRYLSMRPRPGPDAGLLALGDPVYEDPDASSEPKTMPDHGLLVNVVLPGSNAAAHGLKAGDVLLAYDGTALNRREDLKAAPESKHAVPIEVWREGSVDRRELAGGKLGVVLDPRPAPAAIAANRAMHRVLMAARSGGEDFAPLPGTRYEVESIGRLFRGEGRPARVLLGPDASEPELDRLAAGELGRYGFIHLATHGVVDERIPARSAVILTQTGLPDPLEQALAHRPVFDGRLTVREIQRSWDLDAELVTLSACETALGRQAGGEGFVGFTQALLMAGARSVCLSLWKVDDTATALLMRRFYANLLGRRPGLAGPMPRAEALREAKAWLRGLRRSEATAVAAELSGGAERGKGAKGRRAIEPGAAVPGKRNDDRPYAAPHYWAAFVLAGNPD